MHVFTILKGASSLFSSVRGPGGIPALCLSVIALLPGSVYTFSSIETVAWALVRVKTKILSYLRRKGPSLIPVSFDIVFATLVGLKSPQFNHCQLFLPLKFLWRSMPWFNQCELMCMIFPFANRTGEETVLREPVYSLCTFFFLFLKVFFFAWLFIVKAEFWC